MPRLDILLRPALGDKHRALARGGGVRRKLGSHLIRGARALRPPLCFRVHETMAMSMAIFAASAARSATPTAVGAAEVNH